MLTESLSIPAAGVALRGTLVIPPGALGLVVFAHGSGSSQHSPRNQLVASVFQQRGLATLLLDLWTPDEAEHEALDATFQIDAGVLAERLIGAIDGIVALGSHRGLPIGVFGGGEGAAAAVIAATRRPEHVTAIACRGGRLDLAWSALAAIRVPTMLIVGSGDTSGVRLHRAAARAMVRAPVMVVISGANQLFEQPGALDEVATTAAGWFTARFTPPAVARTAAGG